MKTKRERDTCLYFAYNNSLICSVQGAYADYVTNMLYMFLLECGVCKGFEGLLQRTYFFVFKNTHTDTKMSNSSLQDASSRTWQD